MTLILGAVAYDPKVVTIWEGFKRYFQQQGLSFDYVLYSSYEREVEALLDGRYILPGTRLWHGFVPEGWLVPGISRSARLRCAILTAP
jgi:hypothetical protein